MNLIIVEDEPPILREITSMISGLGPQYQVLKTFTNGYDAKEFFLNSPTPPAVDILLTDINLPVIDGLQLIDLVKQTYPTLLCIILTGYSDFNYAKKALQLNVFDYLNKPVDEYEMAAVLKKATDKLFVNRLSTSPIVATTCSTQSESHSDYYISMIHLGSISQNIPNADHVYREAWTRLHLETLLEQQYTLIQNFWLIDTASAAQKILLLKTSSQSDFSQVLRMLFVRFSHLIPTFLITYVQEAMTTSDISHFSRELDTFTRKSICLEYPQLLCINGAKPQHFELEKYYTQIASLYNIFLHKSIDIFLNELRLFLVLLKKDQLPLYICSTLLASLYVRCLQSDEKNESTSINHAIAVSFTYDDLYLNLSVLFETLYRDTIAANMQHDKHSIFLMLDNYIEAHFSENINTSVLAAAFNFTPAYLSKIYTEYKGISPMDAIVRHRMEKARDLLLAEPPLAIKDIALQLGYSDALYFSKVFKKYTTLSPKQYRKVHQQ